MIFLAPYIATAQRVRADTIISALPPKAWHIRTQTPPLFMCARGNRRTRWKRSVRSFASAFAEECAYTHTEGSVSSDGV